MLDQQMKFVLDSGTGYTGSIIAGLKILVIAAYYFVRSKMIDGVDESMRNDQIILDNLKMQKELTEDDLD